MNFKVGDWVEVKDPTELLPHQKEVFKIEFIDKNDNLFGEDSSTEYGNSRYFSLWQPREADWCRYTSKLYKGNKMIVDENMSIEEYRREMLEDQRHEEMLNRDVEYCIENFLDKETIKAINQIEHTLK